MVSVSDASFPCDTNIYASWRHDLARNSTMFVVKTGDCCFIQIKLHRQQQALLSFSLFFWFVWKHAVHTQVAEYEFQLNQTFVTFRTQSVSTLHFCTQNTNNFWYILSSSFLANAEIKKKVVKRLPNDFWYVYRHLFVEIQTKWHTRWVNLLLAAANKRKSEWKKRGKKRLLSSSLP